VEDEEKKSAAAEPPKDADPPPPPVQPPPEEPAKEGWATRAFVGGLRILLPLVDEYARTKGPRDSFERGTVGSLSDDERKAYSEAAVRLVYESAAALRAQSPQNRPDVVDRDPKTGRYPPLTVADGVLAVRALQSLLKSDEKTKATKGEAAPASPAPEVAGAAPAVEIVSKPPRSPREIRSVAMQQRKVLQASNAAGPARAYATRNQAYAVGAQPRILASGGAAARAPKAAVVYRAPTPGCGCGNAGSSSARPAAGATGCPQCGQQAQEPLAQRNAEGKCEPGPFQISCDTQIKLKQCVKGVICDTLWCLEAAICKNGQPSFTGVTTQTFIDCLGTALCSLIRCVPEVLCPPRTECGPLLPSADIECSYAVEDVP
jgi:hypothetical protein